MELTSVMQMGAIAAPLFFQFAYAGDDHEHHDPMEGQKWDISMWEQDSCDFDNTLTRKFYEPEMGDEACAIVPDGFSSFMFGSDGRCQVLTFDNWNCTGSPLSLYSTDDVVNKTCQDIKNPVEKNPTKMAAIWSALRSSESKQYGDDSSSSSDSDSDDEDEQVKAATPTDKSLGVSASASVGATAAQLQVAAGQPAAAQPAAAQPAGYPQGYAQGYPQAAYNQQRQIRGIKVFGCGPFDWWNKE
jgi:hypothetical protein